jgi:hypothetical protein
MSLQRVVEVAGSVPVVVLPLPMSVVEMSVGSLEDSSLSLLLSEDNSRQNESLNTLSRSLYI